MNRRPLLALLLGLLLFALARPAAAGPPAEVQAFLDDVFRRLPAAPLTAYRFQSWQREGWPTAEGFGMAPVAGLDPERLIQRVMDVDHYKGNIAYVAECRSVADARFVQPKAVRFYQRVDLPMLGSVHHELVLVDGGTRQGYRYAYWYLLDGETAALDPAKGARSAYSTGAWIVGNGMLGYALSNAPRREDVSWPKWQAMTSGADMTAKPVVKANIEGMAAWAQR